MKWQAVWWCLIVAQTWFLVKTCQKILLRNPSTLQRASASSRNTSVTQKEKTTRLIEGVHTCMDWTSVGCVATLIVGLFTIWWFRRVRSMSPEATISLSPDPTVTTAPRDVPLPDHQHVLSGPNHGTDMAHDRAEYRQELAHADAGDVGAEVSMCTTWFRSRLRTSRGNLGVYVCV